KGQLINNKTDVKLTKLLELLLALLLLIMAIFIIEKHSNINTVIMITCTVLMFTFIWCLYLRDITSMVKEMKIFLNYIIPSRSNEIVLFVTAGLFGYVTSDTPFGEYVDNIWINIAGVSMFLTIILT